MHTIDLMLLLLKCRYVQQTIEANKCFLAKKNDHAAQWIKQSTNQQRTIQPSIIINSIQVVDHLLYV